MNLLSILPEPDSKASDPGVLTLLEGLVRVKKPELVLETGTYRGHGALSIVTALQANGRGHLHTCDPVDHGFSDVVRDYKLEEWVTFHQQGVEELLAELEGVDLAYIDHSGGSRAPIFELVRQKLSPGGVIVVDDTNLEAPWHDGVGGRSKLAVRSRCQLNLEGARGLSIYHNRP